jgi:flavin reductase ActVB
MTEATLDQMQFRNAMARFPSGVTVVTTVDPDGKHWGFTASAFSSLSLEPPLLLVCLDKRADSHPAFHGAGHFGVSILAAHQGDVAMRFAAKGVDKFVDLETHTGDITGVPLIRDAVVHLECRTYQHLEGGDHTIIVGEVLRAANAEGEPMVHYNRNFGHFAAGSA